MNIHKIVIPVIAKMKCDYRNNIVAAFRACRTWPPSAIPEYEETIKRLQENIVLLETVQRQESYYPIQPRTPVVDLYDEHLQQYTKRLTVLQPAESDAPSPVNDDPLKVFKRLADADLLPRYATMDLVYDKDGQAREDYKKKIN